MQTDMESLVLNIFVDFHMDPRGIASLGELHGLSCKEPDLCGETSQVQHELPEPALFSDTIFADLSSCRQLTYPQFLKADGKMQAAILELLTFVRCKNGVHGQQTSPTNNGEKKMEKRKVWELKRFSAHGCTRCHKYNAESLQHVQGEFENRELRSHCANLSPHGEVAVTYRTSRQKAPAHLVS